MPPEQHHQGWEVPDVWSRRSRPLGCILPCPSCIRHIERSCQGLWCVTPRWLRCWGLVWVYLPLPRSHMGRSQDECSTIPAPDVACCPDVRWQDWERGHGSSWAQRRGQSGLFHSPCRGDCPVTVVNRQHYPCDISRQLQSSRQLYFPELIWLAPGTRQRSF